MRREGWDWFGGWSTELSDPPLWVTKKTVTTKTPIAASGWICPRCQAVHAPHVRRCDCPPPTETADTKDATL